VELAITTGLPLAELRAFSDEELATVLDVLEELGSRSSA
jgi:hypothetical protein